MSIIISVQFVQSVVDERLVEHDAEALEVVATVTCNTRASFHFKNVQTLHDLVMSQLTHGGTISNNSAFGAPGSHDLVQVLVLGDDDIGVDDVANFTKHLLGVCFNVFRRLFLSLDRLVECLGLFLFFGNVCLLIGLFLGSDSSGQVVLFLLHIVKSEPCCIRKQSCVISANSIEKRFNTPI